MIDLSALLGKVKKGAAAEGALEYFGDELRRRMKDAGDVLEAAFFSGDARKAEVATAQWIAYRQIFRTFERDMKHGEAASKEVNG